MPQLPALLPRLQAKQPSSRTLRVSPVAPRLLVLCKTYDQLHGAYPASWPTPYVWRVTTA